MRFCCTLETVSLPAAGLSSLSRLQGTQRGRVYTKHKFGPRPGSVARVLSVQSRASWQVIMGWASAEPAPWRTMVTPHFKVSFLLHCRCCIMPASHRLSCFQALYFVAATDKTAAAHRALPFVTANDGASLCACACHISYILRTNT